MYFVFHLLLNVLKLSFTHHNETLNELNISFAEFHNEISCKTKDR